MRTIVTIAVVTMVGAFYLPKMLSGSIDGDDAVAQANYSQPKKKRSKTARAYRDGQGHFSFNAKLNGNHVKVLVDTGATSVAINWSTARRIGINLSVEDFRHRVSTANGETRMARANIDEIRIDGIVVRNVTAAVLDDKALRGTLLGMSFLNKLKRFEIVGNTLNMIQ